MRPTILLCLLSFCGYFLLGLIECIQQCEPNFFYVTWPNGSFKDCLHCSPCHPGWGLYPNCGEHITYPPTDIHCKKCVYGKTFSEVYDYSGCKSCHNCAEHEIVTKNCTRESDTVCSGTCIQGYFYRNSTRDCQKCSYCCNDGKDDEQQECLEQGLKATHRYCAPRPDKRCGPAPTSLATTQHNPITTSSAKHLKESKDQQQTVRIALILSCTGIGICSVFGGIHIWRRWRKRRNGSLRNAENGALAIEAVNIPPTNEGSQNHGGQEMVRMPRVPVVGIQQNEGFVSNNSTPQGSCRVTPSHSDDELDESPDVEVKPTKHLHVWKQQKSKEEKKEKNANNSTTERLLDSAQDNNALSSISENRDEQPGREGAEGGHERKSSRSGSLHEVIFRKMSLTKDPTYNPLPNEDPDQPQQANNSTTERLSDSAQDNNALSSISENRDEQPGRKGAEGGHERKSSRSGSIHEVILRKMSLTKDPTYKPLPKEDPDRPQGAPGGHERKRSRSGSIFAIGRKSSISPLDAKPDYPSLPAAGEDPDQPLGKSCPSLTIEEHPRTQKQTEGSRVELKCIVKGGTKVTYQWFKDGAEVPEEKSSSLILHKLKVQDFGFYKCEVRSCDAGQHNSCFITSHVAELDVAPSAGRDYRLLKDVFEQSLDTQRTVENLLCKEIMRCRAWEQVAFKYKMDLNYLNSKRSGDQGEEVIAYLKASNPNLSVYNFCKTLKEDSIRRLDIVDELSSYLV
ncbi:uncharacterized protein [Montipora foliosa]|uniref:uncharacterized protein isoform X1 n=1 Tax=Montipora foliosa TaxID=591990 RepID=UPI0035F20B4E